MFLSHLSIRMKIAAGFSIPIVLFVGFSIFLTQSLMGVKGTIVEVKNERIVYALLAKDLDKDITQIQQFLTDISATRAQDGLSDGSKEAQAHYDSALAGLDKFQQFYQAKGDKKHVDALIDLRSRVDQFYLLGKKMAQAYIDGGPGEGNKLMPQFDQTSLSLQASLAPFVQQELDQMNVGIVSAAHQSDLILKIFLWLSVTVVLLSLIAAAMITRSIIGPLTQILDAVDDLGKGDGDLTYQLPLLGHDFGRLAESLNIFIQKLHVIISAIRQSSTAVASTSGQIASVNLDLSSRAEDQASAIQETAAAMEELSCIVGNNAVNAKQANELVACATQVAIKGGQVVSQVVVTMASINDSSKKIVDIISVIDGIAFQTNILALNAAVEAARAGEQGRGFAVVAAEVRNLAQRSAAAAKEIKALISASVNEVDAGGILVASAGLTMKEIVTSVARVSDIMEAIARASHEQSLGIAQANDAISLMESGAQRNASLAEQSAAATQLLHQEAENLTRQVNVFKLDENFSERAIVSQDAPSISGRGGARLLPRS